jgi:hypothetical protein
MEKVVNATFDGEVCHPDEPIDLPRDSRVKIVFDEHPSKPRKKLKLEIVPKKPGGKPYAWLKIAREAKLSGPSDFSENLDDYLYHGKPFPDEE